MNIEQNINSQEEFIVTARKWRPHRFIDVVGQEHITITLQNAIKNSRIHHALMFSGPRGVGKTTTARIYARAVNCSNPQNFEPCNECASCKSILDARSMDVIEIDGASNNSVDDIRNLRENSKYPPINGKYKIYVIDEVHMLSTSAFNALLKTLEEPPPHLLFVFATTESHKVPATIISRCQRFDFRRMELDSIVNQLKHIADKESITIDEESLMTIAKKGDGSMRDSQSIFDQVIAFCGKDVHYKEMADALHLIDEEFYFKISTAIHEKNVAEMFALAQLVISKGYDFQETLHGLLEHFRNLLALKATGNTSLIETSKGFVERYNVEVNAFSHIDLLRIMNIINSTELSLKFAPQPRIKFELALMNLASLESLIDLNDLLAEIKEMKKNPQLLASTVSEKSQIIKDTPVHYVSGNTKASNSNNTADTKQEAKAEISNIPKEKNWENYVNIELENNDNLNFLKHANGKITTNEAILEFDKSFPYDMAIKSKDILNQSIRNYFGKNLNLVLMQTNIQSPDNPGTPKSENDDIFNNTISEKTSNKKREPTKQSLENKTPAEVAVIKLFGAQEAN